MIIAVTGASGFIGTHLVARLLSDGHSVRAIGRGARSEGTGVPFFRWATGSEPPAESLRDADAVIHLAGEPVAQRWNAEVKRRIQESRVQGTGNVVAALGKLQTKPAVFVASSAVGYYGDRGDELLTESSAPGKDFLANVCVAWERESQRAADLGIRTVMLRTGIALGREGGALKQMLGPFKAGVGGPAGSGKQWVSWIHVQDLVALIAWSLNNTSLSGPVNATAPQQIRNAEFAHELGHALGRPSAVPTPAFALKLLFGEMAQAVLASQRVAPEAAVRAGFHHRFPELRTALTQILS